MFNKCQEQNFHISPNQYSTIINLSLVSPDTSVLTLLVSVLKQVDSSPDSITGQTDVGKSTSSTRYLV